MSCPTIAISRPRPQLDTTARQLRGPLPGSSPAARIIQFIQDRWSAYWDWRARKATILLLCALDARTLHDIGISPGEIDSLVRGASDRCRCYDPDWMRRR